MNRDNHESMPIKKLSLSELSMFSYQLSLILKSGIPYLEGIAIFRKEISHAGMRQITDQLYEDVKSGKKLYESFEQLRVFPDYFVQMTKIAETTGMLDVQMEQLSQYYDKSEKTTYKTRNALVYPIVLFVLMASVLMLIILKVFPVFQEVLASLGGDLPPSTAFIFEISKILQNSALWGLVVIAIIIIGLVLFIRTTKGGLTSDRLKLKIGVLKKIYQRLVTLRFSQGLSMMVKAGISFEDAILLSAPLVGNRYAQSKIEEAQTRITKGSSLVEALQLTEIFPELFIQMVRIGNNTGQLDTMLVKTTNIYETELDRALDRMTSSIEPTLVIILSIVVAAILLTVMLPMIHIMSSIG
ncbi:MAG: type II secretion system F family protein [Dethiosulfatibacter sp.]|nr:type II secretion system F family protein [Dethiosulfatibacter sp.]